MWIEDELVTQYYDSLRTADAAADKMKIWLDGNIDRVDWSQLRITLHNKNRIDNLNKKKSEMFLSTDLTMGGRFITKANPVETISFVLDEIDMDFSVTVNGKEFWWIPNNDVGQLYQHAINNLKSESND